MPTIKIPAHFIHPSTVKSVEEWATLINSIYTGDIATGALPDIYSPEQLYGEAVKVISAALGMQLNLLPGDPNFVENHIYNVVISYIAQQLFLEQEPIENIQEAFEKIFAAGPQQSRATLHDEIIKIMASQIKQQVDKASYRASFTVNGFKIEKKLNKEIYRLHNKDQQRTVTTLDEDGLMFILERNLTLIINKESNIYKNLLPMVNNLSKVATISRYGAYMQPLIDDLYDPITKNPFKFPLLSIYATMALSSVPQPHNFDMFSPVQKQLYDLLAATLRKTEEHVLARRFALHAAREQNSEKIPDPKIKLVNSFKGDAGQENRVRYLVLEMLRNGVKPKDLAKQYGEFAELKLAAALYKQCAAESKNLKIPTRADLSNIEPRVKNGELNKQDLLILMRHANRSVLDAVAQSPISFMSSTMQKVNNSVKRTSAAKLSANGLQQALKRISKPRKPRT